MLSWLVLVPPLLVIALSFITKKVVPSLVIGIVAAGFIATNFSLLPTTTLVMQRFIEQFDRQNLYTFGFLILLGIIISLMNHTGGTAAYSRVIKKRLTSIRSVETTSIVLSLLFAIDDFFSILTVGSIMKPVTDSFNIPRVKLAYLIDSLAAPMVILVPISSWIAMILSQLEKAGISLQSSDQPLIHADPLDIYFASIPFVFYSFITLFVVFFIVQKQLSFGAMRSFESREKEYSGETIQTKTSTGGSLSDFIVPIASLLLSASFFLLYLGNYSGFGGTNTLTQAIRTSDIFLALFLGALSALLISLLFFSIKKRLSFEMIIQSTIEGWSLMKDSLIILLLAWTFSSLLKNDLQTGNYLAQIFLGSIHAALLPVLFFITAFITAAGTGSSWGTIAVFLPLAVPMIASLQVISLLLPVLGAIFAGAVAGDNLSPLGTTTIMAATTTECSVPDHALTQLPYGLASLVGSIVAFSIAGFLINLSYLNVIIISLAGGIITALVWLLLSALMLNKKIAQSK